MHDQLTAHLTAARDELTTAIAACDEQEILLRGHLDEVLGERTRHQALLVDLDQLLAVHTTAAHAAAWPAPAELTVGASGEILKAPITTTKQNRRQPGELSHPDTPAVHQAREAEWAAIAATARAAHAAGASMSEAIAAKHGKTVGAASALMTKLRQRGYDIPKLRGTTTTTPAQPKPPAPTKPAKPTKPAAKGSVDLHEVARVVIEADAAGQPPIPALVAHFRKPESTVKNWLKRVRDSGMVPRSPRPNLRVVDEDPSPPRPAALPAGGLQEVADTFREACEVNRRPIQTIVDRYDVDREVATEWVALCRADGLLPPKGEPVVPAEAPLHFVSRH